MPESGLRESTGLLSLADENRIVANEKLAPETKSAIGQYMTPAHVASFMASLFPLPQKKKIRLLDPGAGVGSLTSAFVERFCMVNDRTELYCFDVDAYEIDRVLQKYLEENLTLCKEAATACCSNLTWEVISKDFIAEVTQKLASQDSFWREEVTKYTHCIMNPPYKKMASSSQHRLCLRTVGIETVNLYSAFVALSVLLLEDGGYLVAIIPRSFCNGPYYQPFRQFLLNHAAIRRIHLFGSRDKAFKDDGVLQENIIIVLEKGGKQQEVSVSMSTDDSLSDISISKYPFDRIVMKRDNELFIHIPRSTDEKFLDISKVFEYTLSDIGLGISTGPVVDFRLKPHLRGMPEMGTVPLLYPCHFKKDVLHWPIQGGKKPNAIMSNEETRKWLYPNGFYTVVRRFSSKEERRRVVANVVDPTLLGGFEVIGLENHLNVFHENKQGISEFLARGLSVYLNSTVVDEFFRRFSGHTQVNATDLKRMKYPSRKMLVGIGTWSVAQGVLTQEIIDRKIEEVSG